MSALSDYKTHNGTSLQALADFLLEQCAQGGCRGIFLIIKPEGGVSIVTNVKGQLLPDVLDGMALEMRMSLATEKKVEEPS